jgi:prophage regulatory protein
MYEEQSHSLSLLRLKEVKSATGMSRSWIYEAVRCREFPAPINLGARAVGWLAHEVNAWIAARITEARGESA